MALRLRVGPVEPRLAAFLTTLSAGAVGLGGSFLMLLLVLGYADSDWLVDEPAGWVLVGMLMIMAAMLAGVLAWQRRLRGLSGPMQWALSATAWVVVLGLMTLFIACFEG